MEACDLQIATIADTVYGVWAKYRLQVTGTIPFHRIFQITIIKKVLETNSRWI